jgi:hypothetical protein
MVLCQSWSSESMHIPGRDAALHRAKDSDATSSHSSSNACSIDVSQEIDLCTRKV